MSTRYVRRSSGGPATSSFTGSDAPIGVNADTDQLEVVTSDGAGSTRKFGVSKSLTRAVTASATAYAADAGTTFVADSTTSVVITLPATAAGLKYTLVVGQLTSSAGHAFSPAAADKIMGNGFTAADDKDAICSAATDRVGDSITLVGDGVDGWYIVSVVGTWARE